MLTIPVWLLLLTLYFAFNLGFIGALLARNWEAHPRWTPDWLGCMLILVLPVPMLWTASAILDRLARAYDALRSYEKSPK